MKYWILFGTCLTYALVRYTVFGDVQTVHIPSYIVNKALAFSSIFALLFAAVARKQSKREPARHWFAFFKASTALHILLSLALFSPAYFPKIFQDGKLTLYGELTLLFGVLGIFMFWSKRIVEFESPSAHEWIKRCAVVSLALHQLFLGLQGWFKPETWFGHMPPITLICFVGLCVVSIMQAVAFRKRNEAE